MNNLICANFMRIKNNNSFLKYAIIIIAVGVLIPVRIYFTYRGETETYEIMHLDSNFFITASYALLIFSAVFCSTFFTSDISDGTVRNKIIAGHTREKIYFSNLFTGFLMLTIMMSILFLTFTAVGTPLLGFFKRDFAGVIKLIFTVLMYEFAFFAIFLSFTMNSSKKVSSVLLIVFSAIVLLSTSTVISSALSEPQFYSPYSELDVNDFIHHIESYKNPYYVDGIKREIYQFLDDFLPGGQFYKCFEISSDYSMNVSPKLAFYSLCTITVSTLSGLFAFKRKSIK